MHQLLAALRGLVEKTENLYCPFCRPPAPSYVMNECSLGCNFLLQVQRVPNASLLPHLHGSLHYPPTFRSQSQKHEIRCWRGNLKGSEEEGTSPRRSREKTATLQFLPHRAFGSLAPLPELAISPSNSLAAVTG